jgi:hypothetical protein
MPKKMRKYKKNLLQNMASVIFFAVLFWFTLPTSVDTSSASTSSPPQSNLTTIIPPLQQQLQVPQQNQQQQVPPRPQPPQISWNELEEVESFIANGKINSTLYTINGNWIANGDWKLNVVDGELTNFNTTMSWYNGTASHSHQFLNFETEDDVDISAEDQTISIAGTMDIGTNGVVSWQDIPSEILIEGGRIITVSLDDEGTNRHFGGQSVHGNVTSISICSATPGPSMEVSPTC